MTKYKNPYNWNKVNLDLFFGRGALASDICRRLTSRTESFAIIGGRRMGKTTLLRKIEETLNTQRHDLAQTGCTILPIYIDFQGLGPAQDLRQVWGEILNRIADRARALYGIESTSLTLGESTLKGNSASNPFKIVSSALLSFLSSASKGPLVIVVLLDEIEGLLLNEWCDDFWRNWRALLHNTPGVSENLGIVLSGSVELTEIAKDRTSSLFGVLEPKFLEVFSLEESKRLITEPGDMPIGDSIVANVTEWTGGHPFVIQYLMSYLYDNQHLPLQDVLDVARRSFLEGQEYILRTWWSQLGPIGRDVYRLLTAAEAPVRKARLISKWSPEDVNWALDVICSSGIGRRNSATSFTATSALFQQWLRENGLLDISETQHVSAAQPEVAMVQTDIYSCKEWSKRNEVDQKLKIVELELRSAISRVYQTECGADWEERLKACIAKFEQGRSIQDIEERCRMAPQKYASPLWVAPPQLIHYTTIGHLEALIASEWEKFNFIFGTGKEARKRFCSNFAIIAKMRNELSHPLPIEYPIPQTELMRAEVACDDILAQLQKNLSS